MTSRPAVLLACAALALAAVVPGAFAAPPQVIKIATLVPKDSAWERVLKDMALEWKTLSGGAVTVNLYAGGVAGDDADVVRKMRLGTLHGALLMSEGLAELNRDVMALQLPLAYTDYAELDCVLEKMAPELGEGYRAKGFVVLGWSDGGFVSFFSRTPLRTPDDLRKAKLFTWAGDDQYVTLWKKAGFNPVPLPATEISTALQSGLVNALPSTPGAALLFNWYAHANYMTDLDWGVLLGAIVVARPAWEQIPAELRPKLEESARKAAIKLRDLTRASEAKDLEAMKKRGLKVVTLTPAERAEWQRVVDGTLPGLKGTFVPAGAMDTALRLRDACRKAGAR